MYCYLYKKNWIRVNNDNDVVQQSKEANIQMTQQFNAFQVTQDDDGKVQGDFIQLTNDDLPEGDVLVKVQYSSINYKDAPCHTRQ